MTPDKPGKQGNPVLNPFVQMNRGLGRPVNPNQFGRVSQNHSDFMKPQYTASEMPQTDPNPINPVTYDPNTVQPVSALQGGSDDMNSMDENSMDKNINHIWHEELGHPVNTDQNHRKSVSNSAKDLGL